MLDAQFLDNASPNARVAMPYGPLSPERRTARHRASGYAPGAASAAASTGFLASIASSPSSTSARARAGPCSSHPIIRSARSWAWSCSRSCMRPPSGTSRYIARPIKRHRVRAALHGRDAVRASGGQPVPAVCGSVSGPCAGEGCSPTSSARSTLTRARYSFHTDRPARSTSRCSPASRTCAACTSTTSGCCTRASDGPSARLPAGVMLRRQEARARPRARDGGCAPR